MPYIEHNPAMLLAHYTLANNLPIDHHKGVYSAIYNASRHGYPYKWDITELAQVFNKTRPWFSRETERYDIHPMVVDLLTHDNNRPLFRYVRDWREVVLEWPHKALDGSNRIAYTQDHSKGERDIQTVTSFGKYLRRHMPHCPDHLLRDFVLKYTIDPTKCGITDDMDTMIDIVRKGPKSCMSDFCHDDHPYEVYSPQYGWAMAYRMQGSEYWGRALVNREYMIYVRSYKRCANGGYSHSDEMLETWLQSQGYTHADHWEGCKLDKIDDRMPYLDGDVRAVNDCGGYWIIEAHGEYAADSTNGEVEENGRECDECEDRFDDDELHYVEDSDSTICTHCLHNNYAYAISRHGREWIRNDNAVYCASDDEYYDEAYLAYHDIVLPEGEYDHYHIDDTWTCEGSGYIYHESVPSHEIDGETYHADHLPDGWELDEHGALREVETT